MPEEAYTDVPNAVLFDTSLSPGARVVYALILSRHGQFNQGQLAAETGCTPRTIRSHLDELRSRGLIDGRTGYVYVIEVAGFHKIGSARDLKARLTSHQTSSPFDVHLLASAKVGDCFDVERELQRQFKHRQVRLEWFQLTADDLVSIRRRLEDSNG